MKKRILCYGDSNTFGYMPAGMGERYGEAVRWPMKLQELLGSEYQIIEEGCSGRTTDLDGDIPWKNGRAFLKTALHSHKPLDMIILMLGTNDLKECFQRDAVQIAEAAGNLISDAQEYFNEKKLAQPLIILVSPVWIRESIVNGPFGDEFTMRSVRESQKFANAYERISREKNVLFFNAAEHAQASDTDGLHLDGDAHIRLAEALAGFIHEYI